MESSSFLIRPFRTARRRGFTLIEMLVVLFIITVITAVVISGQSHYNKTLLLTDTAYGVALSARESQSFGLASRKYGLVQNPGYGLHFSNVTPGAYTLFADTDKTLSPPAPLCPQGISGTPSAKPGNCRFDATTDGVVENFSFSRGFTVSQFCGKTGSTLYCSTDPTPLTSLDLVFTRPNTSTTISGLLNGSALTSFSCAEVTISDPMHQATRTVRISSIGEISVNQNCSGTAMVTTWTKCADENGTCVVNGTATVRYGAGSSWAYKTVSGSVGCNNGVFGDPIVGTPKECDVSS